MKENVFETSESKTISFNHPSGATKELMLYKYRMKNYKAFHDSGWIRVTGIVMFYGSNSAGKTALHHPLLLLDRAYRYEKSQGDISSIAELDDHNAEYSDIINQQHKDEDITISFGFVDDAGFDYCYNITFDAQGCKSVSVTYAGDSYELTGYYDFHNVFFAYRTNHSIDDSLNNIVKAIMASLRRFAENFVYLDPIRVEPQREYQFHGIASKDIGKKGEKTYDILYSLIDGNTIKNHMIKKWINVFNYDLKWQESGINRGKFVLEDMRTGSQTNLIDNGFGIGQSLPVIVALSTVNDKRILIDSPEAFLQTRAQGEMADYIIDSFTHNNSIIVETSSEYLLYRIRRRIVEGIIQAQDVSIYFVDTDRGDDTKCNYIAIDDHGNLGRDNEDFNLFFSTNFDDLRAISYGG